MINIDHNHREVLQQLAHQAMLDRGLQPDFSPTALKELENINAPALPEDHESIRDMRELLWCSIDNDDSLDLDQLTVAEVLPDKAARVLVAVADVDALVKEGSAINDQIANLIVAQLLFLKLKDRHVPDADVLVPGTIQVADTNDVLQAVALGEEFQPLPHRPLKFRKVSPGHEDLGPAGQHEARRGGNSQPLGHEFIEKFLITMVAAMDDQGFCFLLLPGEGAFKSRSGVGVHFNLEKKGRDRSRPFGES